jgi:pimeloyl-ACP methyl ester carboxylesterase
VFETSYLDLPRGRFATLAHGDPGAPVILCLHGFPDHPPTFLPLMRELAAAGYRVVAPWLRGYAPSTLDGPYDADTIAADAVDLAGALAADEPVILVGHDWGAVAAYGALVRAPDRFRAAVTMAVPHPLAFMANLRRNPAQLRRSWYMFFFQLPAIPEHVVPRDGFAFIDRLWRAWSPGYAAPARDMDELKQCLAASMPAPIAYYRAIARPARELRARLRRVEDKIVTPTLHLHGANDGCVAAALGRGQERFFAGRFASDVVPGVGHFMQIEAPTEIARRILTWVRASAA